jgi:2-oxoglutarate ferredoxin oxidoreductase subunit gamma
MMGYLSPWQGSGGQNVTCLPSYGAEVRGGTANCTVVIATEEIASPVASEPEYAVLMNNPSLFRFQNRVQSGGAIFLNSSMIETRPVRGDLEVLEVPANDLPRKSGMTGWRIW